jgi:predicted Zn-dependent peptidase
MRTLVLTLCLGVLAGTAAAQEKEAPPAPGSPRPFALPQPTRFTLDNGLKVTLVPWGTVPKVRVDLVVRAGNVFEGPREVWLSDLTGRMMREGTESRTGAQISEAAARMGGSLDVRVGEDATAIGGEVLSEFGAEMIGVVADVAMRPVFPEAELDRVKADLDRRLAVARSQPASLADEKFRAVLFGDHPYGRTLPQKDALAALNLPQVRAFYQGHFGAGRSHLYVVGVFDSAATEEAIRRAFSGWARGPAPEAPRPSSRSERALFLVDRPGAVQSTILLGLPVVPPSSPEYVPLQVTHTLLGGSFASRITSNIREQKGYTYSPFATIVTHPGHAYWYEQADVTTAVTGASLKEIFAEIDRLQAEPPPAPELDGVKKYMAGTFVLRNSSREGIINQLRFLELHGLPDRWLADYVSAVQATTPAQVSEMARKHLQDDRMAIVIVGDRKAIEAQVKPFGKIVE